MLAPADLMAIVEDLHRFLDLSAVREHAIELDPRHVTPEFVKCLAEIGVNRASLGVQDLTPAVQEAIGRVQPYETVARAVDLLRREGIDNLNFDLMYGLPRQTCDDVRATAERICQLEPQRVALFGYAHVPWFKKRQRLIDEAELPGSGERLDQMTAAREVFLRSGFQPIGLDHFAVASDSLALAARTGSLRRNFQGYTTDDADALIGLGASAIGKLPEGYVQNAPDIGGYSRAVEAGAFATVRGITLSPGDRLRAHVIEPLMCDLRVDLKDIPSLEAVDRFASEVEALEPPAAEGLVRIDAGRISITDRGQPYVRLIAAAFDAYLTESARAHTRAI